MTHTVRDHDGMKVLIVADMDRRYDEEGNLLSKRDMENVELVHASEIAKYFGIPLRTIGMGKDAVKGVWAMVHENEFGMRVAYNTEETKPGNRNVRQFKIIKDASGNPIETKEVIVRAKTHHKPGGLLEQIPLVEEVDDGMYVRLQDVLDYASAMGWKKGGGRPGTAATAAHANDTNEKLDKLTDLITGLATIVAQQTVTAPVKK